MNTKNIVYLFQNIEIPFIPKGKVQESMGKAILTSALLSSLSKALGIKFMLDKPVIVDGKQTMLRQFEITKTGKTKLKRGRSTRPAIWQNDLRGINRALKRLHAVTPGDGTPLCLGAVFVLAEMLRQIDDDLCPLKVIESWKATIAGSKETAKKDKLKALFDALGVVRTGKKILFGEGEHLYEEIRVSKRFPMDGDSNTALKSSFRMNIIMSAVTNARDEVMSMYHDGWDLKVERCFYYLNQRVRMCAPDEDALKIINRFKASFAQADMLDYEQKASGHSSNSTTDLFD